MEYHLVRSRRTTIGLEINYDGLLVRAPIKASQKDIEAIIREKEDWILKNLKNMQERKQQISNLPPLSPEELHSLAVRAANYIPKRARCFGKKIGVQYGQITIRNQRTRWGSCSTNGNLNFNCLLMLMPPEIIDSVIVHELCHLIHHNHSAAFYATVESILPNYRECQNWLKENGYRYLARLG